MCEKIKTPRYLEKCPCCSGTPELRRVHAYNRYAYAVVCSCCGIRTGNWYVNTPQIGPDGIIECTRYSDLEAQLLAEGTWNHRERLLS